MVMSFPFLRTFGIRFFLLSGAGLAGCAGSSLPEGTGETGEFSLYTSEDGLGSTVVELVPGDDVVRVACRSESNRQHCGAAEANRALAGCVAKLPKTHACRANTGACFRREPRNMSCQRSAESYATLNACAAPLARSCAFYAQCLEKAVTCGEAGYALGFGEKFCNGFRRTEFSGEGTAWVNSVMVCLQRSMVPSVQNATNVYRNASIAPASAQVCGRVLDSAFAAHPGCYTKPDASICFLGAGDIAKIFGVIGAEEVFTARTRSQIASTVGTCVGQIARRIVGIPLAAPGTNAPSFNDDRLVRANLGSLRITGEMQALLEQRALWLDYANQYGVASQ